MHDMYTDLPQSYDKNMHNIKALSHSGIGVW